MMAATVHLAQRARAKIFTLLVASAFQALGKGATIVPPFRFANLGHVSIGRHVTIHQGSWIQVVGDGTRGVPVISIGDFASLGMGTTISAVRGIRIGEHALFARNVYVADHGHEYHDTGVPIALQGLRDVAEVRIGAGAWLGQNVVVMPGVTIGCNAVIGANSVVTCDVPDHSVAVGAPARVVRRFNSACNRWEKVDGT